MVSLASGFAGYTVHYQNINPLEVTWSYEPDNMLADGPVVIEITGPLEISELHSGVGEHMHLMQSKSHKPILIFAMHSKSHKPIFFLQCSQGRISQIKCSKCSQVCICLVF